MIDVLYSVSQTSINIFIQFFFFLGGGGYCIDREALQEDDKKKKKEVYDTIRIHSHSNTDDYVKDIEQKKKRKNEQSSKFLEFNIFCLMTY